MCYKIPHAWSCGHSYAWSPIHCATATAHSLKPTEHCDHPMAPGDPDWKIHEEIPCPDCQRKERESSDSGSEKEDEPQPPPNSIAHDLALLERELEDLESGDLDAALRESAHHHSLLHETHLEEAKKRSLADVPENHHQSLEAYAEAMQKAREESQRHWEEELGMGVYVDHEEAVKRARLESYRELLEGYRRVKRRWEEEGENGEQVVDSGDATGADNASVAAAAGPSSPPAKLKSKSRTWRWPFQDDDHRQLYEDDSADENVTRPERASSSSSRLREGAAMADPAESLAGRPSSHASQTQAEGDEVEHPEVPEKSARDVEFGRQRSRPRGILKKIRVGGGDKK